MADITKNEVVTILNQLVNSFNWEDPWHIRRKLISDKADEIISLIQPISKEHSFKCNKCGFEFTSDDLGHTYGTCTQPFPQRTSGICGGAIELKY